MCDFETFCAVCAGPTEEVEMQFDENGQLTTSWLSKITLLHREDRADSFSVQETLVEGIEGPCYKDLRTGETITVCDDLDIPESWPQKPLYIACHRECLLIAKKATNTVERLTIQRIWQHLEDCYRNVAEIPGMPVCNIKSGLSYGRVWRFQEMRWINYSDDSDLYYEGTVGILHPAIDTVIVCWMQAQPEYSITKRIQ